MSAFSFVSALSGPLAACLSGLLVAIAFPGQNLPTFSIFYFLPIALVPVFVAVENLATQSDRMLSSKRHVSQKRHTGLHAAFLFWLMGVVINCIAFFWTTTPAVLFGQVPRIAAYPLFFVYCLLSAVFYPIIFFPYIWNVLRSEKRKIPLPVWVLVTLITALELFTPRFFLWTFGSLLHDWNAVSQWSSLLGFSGGTAFILFSNILIARAWSIEPRTFSKLTMGIIVSIAFWIFVHLFGQYRINLLATRMERMPRTRIGWIQPNFTFSELSSNPNRPADAQEMSLANVLTMSEQLVQKAGEQKLDLLVWPESVSPYDLGWNKAVLEKVQAFAMQYQVPLLVQATEYNEKEVQEVGMREATVFSSSFLVRPDGARSASYLKWVPIPFGEMVPLESHFPALGVFLRKHVGNLSKVGVGTSYQALAYSPEHSVAPLICFDAIEPSLPRMQTLKGRASIFVNQANFVWMDRSNAGYEFLELGRFRAIENARSFLLVSNTGPSVGLDPLGREIAPVSKLMSQNMQITELPVNTEFTFFTRYGNLVLYIMLVASLVWIALFNRATAKR